ncbi:MAG: DEAD/DEAH box helicase [Planctomycetes bacterium]|nr:DEAD/DEAH box helicase [Planctomycetota bacterium]
MQLTITINSALWITNRIPERIKSELYEKLTFENPAYIEAEKYERSTRCMSEYLTFMYEDDNYFVLPRGFLHDLKRILYQVGVRYIVKDNTTVQPPVEVPFKAKLYDYQEEVLKRILANDCCTIEAPTGSGKTLIALKAIQIRGQRTLVIVHTKELLYQWRDRSIEHLGLDESQINLVGDGNKYEKGKLLTIAIINSARKIAKDITNDFGFVIVDEAHRIASSTYTHVLSYLSAKYLLGLSATCYRRDGLTRLIGWYCGPVVHKIGVQPLQEQKIIMRPTLRARETDFYYDFEDSYPELISHLVDDDARNELILGDALGQIRTHPGGISLIVSDRKQHCEYFYHALGEYGVKVRLLLGNTKASERKSIVDEINKGSIQAVVSTLSLISEGFDGKRLSSIHMASPVSYSGRVIQTIGRILRTAEGKQMATIYDYFDNSIGVLYASGRKRLNVYRQLGIKHAA